MKRIVTFSLLAILLILRCQRQQESATKTIAFTNVTIIDGTGSPPKSAMTVVITGNRITAIGPIGKPSLPENSSVVDMTGRFMIPGLWDMHVHTVVKETFLPLYVANGITGVRDTAMDLDTLLAWREEIERGTLLGPRMIVCGPLVDGPNGVIPDISVFVETAQDGINIVHDLRDQRSDFIKLYNFLSEEAYYAIAEEAKKLDIPFVGHVPLSVGAAEASEAGQKSIEHLSGILLACSHKEAELRKSIIDSIQLSNFSPRIVNRLLFSSPPKEILKTYDDGKAKELFKKFVHNKTWQVPTLSVLRAISFGNDEGFSENIRGEFLPSFFEKDWEKAHFKYRTRDGDDARKRFYQKELDLVQTMHEAGVDFLAGTDTPNPYVIPGFSLHDELELLVHAGFTPMEALQTATINPAEFLGIGDSLGTVAPGKIADLVLLDANPLEDIRNTRKIAGVVIDGYYLSKQDLDKLLKQIEVVASQL